MNTLSAVSGNTGIPLTHIVRATYSEGRIAVPVKTPHSLYARFKHITGIPAFSDSYSVPYNRLKQLDLIIDQLSRAKNTEIIVDMDDKDSRAVESMFMQYSGELRSRLNSELPDFNQGLYSPGIILNLTA